ncbi:MAG: AtuA-related protein, partial [Acidimicrobiales bacterium]
PGMYGLGGGPSPATPFGVYRPAAIASDLVPQYVHVLGGSTVQVESVVPTGAPIQPDVDPPPASGGPESGGPESGGPTVVVPLGTVVGTRSGDKGGDANLGVFARSASAWSWLDAFLTVDRMRELLPETATLSIDRHRFPAIRSLNFVLHGLLEEGVAASTRQDAQAKAVGEWLRARLVPVPQVVLDAPPDVTP